MAQTGQTPSTTALVLGLGNPGAKYSATRHNLGAMAVGELAQRHGIRLTKKNLGSLWGKGIVDGRKAILAMPQTYMNRSGQAAAQLVDYFDLAVDDVLAAHDDLDLALGRLKVAVKGGSGGHKGIASLTQSLGTDQFARLKLGIGRPRHQEEIDRYVLNPFYADEHEEVWSLVKVAADCLEVVLTEGPQAAMQKFHRPINEEVEG